MRQAHRPGHFYVPKRVVFATGVVLVVAAGSLIAAAQIEPYLRSVRPPLDAASALPAVAKRVAEPVVKAAAGAEVTPPKSDPPIVAAAMPSNAVTTVPQIADTEASRQEAARQEAARQELIRGEALRKEALRKEAVRKEAARKEAARQDAIRQQAARQELARKEEARKEAARQDAARKEAARKEAARKEAARQEAEQQQAAREDAARSDAAESPQAAHRLPHSLRHRVVREATTVDVGSAAQRLASMAVGTYALVAEARRYIGTNPTARADLWCARFMNFVLNRRGYRGTNSDAALSFASYGHRVAGPRIGAIAVMRRKGGGHVGIVSGIDRYGNPILISGNNGRYGDAETVYPRARILAYVLPKR
jgi:uncharacterized protein (TIGR02594 family)